jgi:hypothetical protein
VGRSARADAATRVTGVSPSAHRLRLGRAGSSLYRENGGVQGLDPVVLHWNASPHDRDSKTSHEERRLPRRFLSNATVHRMSQSTQNSWTVHARMPTRCAWVVQCSGRGAPFERAEVAGSPGIQSQVSRVRTAGHLPTAHYPAQNPASAVRCRRPGRPSPALGDVVQSTGLKPDGSVDAASVRTPIPPARCG